MKKVIFFEDHRGTVTGDQLIEKGKVFECSDEHAKIIVENKWGKLTASKGKEDANNDLTTSNT